MIKLLAITEMFMYYGDTCYKTNDLITEFDDSKDIVFEFFQTKDKEYIYSKGYSGEINFEYYSNKKI